MIRQNYERIEQISEIDQLYQLFFQIVKSPDEATIQRLLEPLSP
jgi:hypothetical protein